MPGHLFELIERVSIMLFALSISFKQIHASSLRHLFGNSGQSTFMIQFDRQYLPVMPAFSFCIMEVKAVHDLRQELFSNWISILGLIRLRIEIA